MITQSNLEVIIQVWDQIDPSISRILTRMSFENEHDLAANLDSDLQDFIQQQQQKAQLQSSAHKLTDMCWDRCIGDRPGQRLDAKTETCLSNCVERFIDASMFLVTRLQKNLQGHS
ncbi:hypothetical protein BV898_04835 [Hypsibius exemplaris]|uniref:Mitochondrial import inner membrane translocase subunit n=1 Tax=Hypsibius exemplaris TaxID=2072580 RepID=A0A1W0X0V1_HYPEX|nr:hypothetical protein BV898_04835 [Hypsibius exemplaris]